MTHAEAGTRQGVRRLLHEFARVQPEDFVLVAYTPDSAEFAAHVVVTLGELGVATQTVSMRPLVDDLLPERLAPKLPHPSSFIGNFVVITLERDTMSHFGIFAQLFARYGVARAKVIRVISASEAFFSSALTLGPSQLSALNATLLDAVSKEREISVRTANGTDLAIELSDDYEWISNRGVLRPGAFLVLPPGEIATYPARVDGLLVADGAMHCNMITRLDCALSAHPVTLTIDNSIAVDVQCDDSETKEFVLACMAMENGCRVGELGFGTNRSLTSFVRENSHVNERHPGLHLGFGQHNQSSKLVTYNALIHMDLVTSGGMIGLPSQGREIDLRAFEPIPGVRHPKMLRDQDVTGDCCSSGCEILTPLGALPMPSLRVSG